MVVIRTIKILLDVTKHLLRAVLTLSDGVSGGEVGALTGPSLMPGGQKDAFDKVSHILESISAKADDGASCVLYRSKWCRSLCKNGAQRYEYADMQLIAESYAMMKDLLGMSHEEISNTFKDWNAGELSSYLIEITGDIFTKLDEGKDEALVEQILDTAGQKAQVNGHQSTL